MDFFRDEMPSAIFSGIVTASAVHSAIRSHSLKKPFLSNNLKGFLQARKNKTIFQAAKLNAGGLERELGDERPVKFKSFRSSGFLRPYIWKWIEFKVMGILF